MSNFSLLTTVPVQSAPIPVPTLSPHTAFAFPMVDRTIPAGRENVTPRHPVAWGVVKARLVAFESHPFDWDGDGATQPAPETMALARRFARQAREHGLIAPEAFFTGDGEVGFRWRGEDAFASASFFGDGHIVAFVRHPGLTDPVTLDELAESADCLAFLREVRKFASV